MEEKGVIEEKKVGYAKVANIMALHPELAIFRRFSMLNIQRVLHLQAELMDLEIELKKQVDADLIKHPRYAEDWWFLRRSGDHGDGEQLRILLEVGAKLKEYNDHLYQLTLLSRVERPNGYDLRFLREWLGRADMGGGPLTGADMYAWRGEEEDLIAVRRRQGGDILTRWFTNVFVPCWHRTVGKRIKKRSSPINPQDNFTNYSDTHVHRLMGVLGTIISSLLPISAIIVLYFVSSMTARLGITAAFTVVFSVFLTLGTQARRVEVFAATAA
ncbi:MAG: hypothetical protein M1840_008601 [Geoglossum simile]|nr:MAG: hypothetical protein M1840_008601 [Geoglossum simile]